MMHLKVLLSDLPSCYCRNFEVFNQLCCRKSYPYMHKLAGRWISTRKERYKLLRFDKNLMESASKILLINSESKRLGEMSPQEVRKLGEEKGMEVVILNKGTGAKGQVVTCKLFSKLQLQEAEKPLKSKSQHKTIELRSSIGEHDLQIKIKKIHQLLKKGNTVCLNAFHKRRHWGDTKPNRNELRDIINKVCSELNVTTGKISVGKSNMLTCTLQPSQLTKE